MPALDDPPFCERVVVHLAPQRHVHQPTGPQPQQCLDGNPRAGGELAKVAGEEVGEDVVTVSAGRTQTSELQQAPGAVGDGQADEFTVRQLDCATVNNQILMSQAQSAQMNMSFGFYGQAILGELDKAYAHAQSAAPETAPVINAARQAALAGDTSNLMSRPRSLGAKFSDIAQKVMLPVLTAFLEDQLGLHS
jgi:hypothetical protein